MRKLTYHWVIVAAIFFIQAAAVGISVNCYNVLSPHIMEEGYTAAQVQAINLARSWVSLLVGIAVGMLIQKLGFRKVTTFGAFCIPLGMGLRSICYSLPLLMASNMLSGVGTACLANVPVTMALNNWFYLSKATASSIGYIGSSIGGFIFVQMATHMMVVTGWRETNIALSIICFVILLPVALFLFREKPEEKGMLPYGVYADDKDGDGKISDNEVTAAGESKRNEPTGAIKETAGITFHDYVRTQSFYWMVLTAFLFGFTNMGFQNNIIIYMQNELGHSTAFTSSIYSMIMIVMIVGKLIGGPLFDRMGMTFTAFYNLVTGLLSVALILLAANPIMAVACGVAFGFRQGLTSLGPPYMTAMIVGRREYSKIYGLLAAFFALGSSTGPVIGAWIFDHTGSYHNTWILFGALMIVLLFSSLATVKTGKGFSNR